MSDPLDFSNKYNTPLSKDEEKKFKQWAIKNNKLNDLYDYDLKGAWKALQEGKISPDERGHLSDMFKKPNHPTFSDQSIYHGIDNYFGGSWINDNKGGYIYKASPTSLRKPEELQQYFKKYEPNVLLMFPSMAPPINPSYSDPFGFTIK